MTNLRNSNTEINSFGMKENIFCVIMHLSLLTGFGVIIPIILWVLFKDQNSTIDQQGKNIINWVISLIIYYAVSIFFFFFTFGLALPLIIIASILLVIFPIIGTVKASRGKIYKYPFTIRFFK